MNAMLDNRVYVVNVSERVRVDLLAHERFGHIGEKKMKLLGLQKLAERCVSGEHRKKPFKGSETVVKTKCVMERVHMDLVGPLEVASLGGARFILTIIDDFSRYSHVYFLVRKCDAFTKFTIYTTQVQNSTKSKIQTVRTDGGGEFCAHYFKRFF